MHTKPQSTGPEFNGAGSAGADPGAGDAAAPALRPLLSFLRHPVFAPSPPGRLTVWRWLGWMCLLILLAYLTGSLNQILVHAFHWPVPAHTASAQFLTHPSWAAVAIMLVAPALEELGFRAFLSTAPAFVFTGLTFFLGYGYLLIEAQIAPMSVAMAPAAVFTHYFQSFWVFLPAGALSLLLYRYRRDAVLQFFLRRAGWVFWTSCVLFGAAHTSLYVNRLVWWGFVLVLPQFLLGVGLAYLRASFGLRWSIAAHYAIDIPSVLGTWLYLSASPAGPLHRGLLVALSTAGLLIMAYGLVVLSRVARRSW